MTSISSRIPPEIGAALAYLLAGAIGCAWVLVHPGAIGHHWDWIVPSLPVELRKLATTNFYAWQDFALGSFVSYRYTTTLMSMLLGLPGFVGLTGAFVTKSLVLGSLAGSAFAMYLLARKMLRDFLVTADDHPYALSAGALYGFSPFAYNQIVAGDQLEMISYAVAPLVLLFILKAISEEGRRRFVSIVAAAVLTAFISASPQTAVIAVAVAICLVIATKQPWKQAIQSLGMIALLATLLCAYWILPVAFGGQAIVEGMATTQGTLADSSLRGMGNVFQSLTTAAEPGSFYLRALPGPMFWAFVAAWLAIWGVILTALVRRPGQPVIGLAFLYVVGALLPLGGVPILGPIILSVFHATQPASLLFRTAQHLIFLPTLVVGLLAAAAAAQLNILQHLRYRFATLACLIAVSSGFIMHSDFLGLIGPIEMDAGERRATDYVASRGDSGRLLFVPTAGGFYYHPGVFDYFFEAGDDGAVRFSPMPSLAPGFKWSPYHDAQSVQKALDELMAQPGRESQQRLLTSLTSVHFVETRAGVAPAGGVFAERYDYTRAVATLESLHFLRPVMRDKRAALWAVSKPVDRIYTPDCTVGVGANADLYDLLPWADEVKDCAAPAFIAGPDTEEVIVHAGDVKGGSFGGGTVMRFGHKTEPVALDPEPEGSNVALRHDAGGTVIADTQDQPYYVILCGVRPHRAFGAADEGNSPHLLIPIAVPESGPYLFSFLAPDWTDRFDARVPLHRGRQVVEFDLSMLGGIGRARIGSVTQLRIANVNPRLVYFGHVDIGPVYEYSADRDVQSGSVDTLPTVPRENGNVVVPDWQGSNAKVSLTIDGGASIRAPAPFFVFESDLTSTRALSSSAGTPLRVYFTVDVPFAGQYLISLLAPDWDHRFDLTVTLPAGQSSTSFTPFLASRFGEPRVDAIRRIRVANTTAFPRPGTVVVGPPVVYREPVPQSADTSEMVAQPTANRWDIYYFGEMQRRLALRNTLTYRVKGLSVPFDAPWAARYRIYLRVQTGAAYRPFAVSVDGTVPYCIDTSLPVDRTEDIVLAAVPALRAGRHTINIQPCAGSGVSGDLAIVSIALVPDTPVIPASHATSIATLEESPGDFTVTLSGGSPTYIVFNDAYDPRWAARQRGRVLDHLHANGFANAWLVEHPSDGPVEIRFQPQRLLNAGYFISALSLVGLLALIFMPRTPWRKAGG